MTAVWFKSTRFRHSVLILRIRPLGQTVTSELRHGIRANVKRACEILCPPPVSDQKPQLPSGTVVRRHGGCGRADVDTGQGDEDIEQRTEMST